MPNPKDPVEQVVRDILESHGDPKAQSYSSGDLVGPANILSDFLGSTFQEVSRIEYHPNGLVKSVQFKTWTDKEEISR